MPLKLVMCTLQAVIQLDINTGSLNRMMPASKLQLHGVAYYGSSGGCAEMSTSIEGEGAELMKLLVT